MINALVLNKFHFIEIGEVPCSLEFEKSFFHYEFGLYLSDYRRMGFCSDGKPEIHIIIKNARILPPNNSNSHIFYHATEYGSVFVTMLFDTRRFEGEIGFDILSDDRNNIMRIAELLETFLCNAYIFYFFFKKNGIFIHSCGIADGAKGYAFVGKSGAGKSTIAELSIPRTILCDELNLLKKKPDKKVRIFGTPFTGQSSGVNKSVNCEYIFFMEKAANAELAPISRLDAVAKLLEEGIIGNFLSLDNIKKMCPYQDYMSLLIDILDGIPCYKLKFAKNDSFWEVINGRQL